MGIIEPSVELFDEINPEQILHKLEVCGKVSRQSKLGDAENFVRSIIKRGHESVLEHVSLTFKIVCDRAIMAELTRHRHASFTVESTRYVKYDELAVIIPNMRNPDMNWLDKQQRGRAQENEGLIKEACNWAENFYHDAIKNDIPPEIARAVLPQCLATTIFMTANLRELRHILKLRTDKAAHPQMRFVASKILGILREKLPVIVEDISND